MRKFISILILSLIMISCDDYLIENYPKLANKTGKYEHIESCYFVETNDFNFFPENIKDSIENYYRKRIGEEYFKRLKFDFGYINSDKPIESSNNKSEIDSLLFDYWEKPKICDSTYLYPVYTAAFNIEIPEIGIGKLAVNLVIDKSGRIVKDFQYPYFENNINRQKIIPIDSVNTILIKRKVSNEKLIMNIKYDEETGSLFWLAQTVVRPGSITGPSCFPEIDNHFFMNMFTGEIIEISD